MPRKTKGQLENELTTMRKILKDNNLLPQLPTKIDEVELLEANAVGACLNVIDKCQKKTGRDLVTSGIYPSEHGQDMKNLVDQLKNHDYHQPTLRSVVDQMVTLVQTHSDYDFGDREKFTNWVIKRIRNQW